MLNYLFWNICTQSADQVAAQRYLTTPDLKAARRAVWVFVFFKIVLTVLLVLCGLALFAYYYRQSGLPLQQFQRQIAPEADKIMPRFIVHALPPGLSGLLVAALLAAAMSSLSSGINSISSVVSADLLPRFRPLQQWKESLQVDKWVSTGAGMFGMLAAMGTAELVRHVDWNLVELSNRTQNVLVGPMGVLFFAGVLFPRVGPAAVLTGFAAGLGISLLTAFSKEWLGMDKSISFLWILPSGFVAGLATTYASSFLFRHTPADSVERVTL